MRQISATKLADYFSLRMLVPVTREFVAPESTFNPKGAWENTYDVYPRQGVPVGSFQIACTPHSKGPSRLRIEYQKLNLRAGPHRIAGEMECGTDVLATPLRWQFTAEFCPPPKSTVESLRTRHTMEARAKTLELASAGFKRSIPRPAAYSSSWALFDAVQRLPRLPGEPLRFTFFDRNFAPKPGHLLLYRETAEVTFPKAPQRRIRLHSFAQLGEGFVPSVYWTDDSGRLLFFVSGTHSYVLRSGNPRGRSA